MIKFDAFGGPDEDSTYDFMKENPVEDDYRAIEYTECEDCFNKVDLDTVRRCYECDYWFCIPCENEHRKCLKENPSNIPGIW